MDQTVKVCLSLILLTIGGLCVTAGAPIVNLPPHDRAIAGALACVLVAVYPDRICADKAVGRAMTVGGAARPRWMR